MIYWGFDPGVTGAYACVDRKGQLFHLADMPTHTIKAGKNRQCITFSTLRDNLLKITDDPHQRPSMCYLERVWGQMGQGAVSAFSFGMSAATIMAALEQAAIPYEDVLPSVWKKRYGLWKTDKTASIDVFNKLYPAWKLTRKKDHNRADAGLMARYCWEQNK